MGHESTETLGQVLLQGIKNECETAVNGRSVAKNAKSGSKTSSTFEDSIQKKVQNCCAHAVVDSPCNRLKNCMFIMNW